MNSKVFNIPASCSFVDVLAEKFIKEYEHDILGLTDVIFLMPNRRACRSLKDAFIRVNGLKALMLPKIVPIGDVDEDDIIISGFDVLEDFKNIPPAIEKTERLLLFIKIIMSKPDSFGIEATDARQASFLANELAKLIDMVNYEGLSFSNLKKIVPDEYASHWQETLKFLQIITHFWPQILKERGAIDVSSRYNMLLEMQSDIWKKSNTKKKIVVAGGMANFPSIRKVIKTVLSLDNGEFYINGLDKFLEEEDWEVLDETHPENEIKLLLEYLKIDRREIIDIVSSKNIEREKFISEVMRPAKTTNKWLDIKNKKIHKMAFHNISLVECENSREEALTIALIMREALDIPEKTTALITQDRNLARRVAVELERWGIKVDDSAGKPLSLSPVGIFIRLVVKACEADFSPVETLGLLKNPITSNNMEKNELYKKVRKYEKEILRKNNEEVDSELLEFIDTIKQKLIPLRDALLKKETSFKELIKLHIDTSVALASTLDFDGNQVLWRNEDGEALAKFFANLYEKADILGEIKGSDYLGLIEAMMINITVRSSYGTHPRLKILGPIEARLNKFDTVIIGGTNEGIWPKFSSADPWMSRPMKKDFGFPMPEKNIGILAKDFSDLIASEEVYLTYSARVDGTPMIKSRWLMRLETVVAAMGFDIAEVINTLYSSWANRLDKTDIYKKLLPPEPRPPISSRPRKLSASAIDDLIRDPYIVFAKYILKLKPLDELEQDLTAADYGNIIHGILDEFNKIYRTSFPRNAKEELIKLGEKYFTENNIALDKKVFWWPKFEKVVDWIVEKEESYRKDISMIYSEIEGSMEIDAPAGKVLLSARADRIDETKEGLLNIIDYKTGSARSPKEIINGYAPQLPLAAIIASMGKYKDIPKREIGKMMYWKLNDKEISIDSNVNEVISNNLDNIKNLVSTFDFETTAYISKPNPKYVSANKDYEHLSRVREWSVVGDEDE